MKIKFILIISFLWSTLSAQDSLFLRNNQVELVKVLTIDDTIITYQLFTDLDSPTYSKSESEIDRIIFSNGEVAVFNFKANVKELPLKGSNIFIVANDSKIRYLTKTANQEFRSWGYWNIVPDRQEADYILEIEVMYNGLSAFSWGKTKLRGILKSTEGHPLWIFEGFAGESNILTGFNPTSAAINKLIKRGIEPNIHIPH